MKNSIAPLVTYIKHGNFLHPPSFTTQNIVTTRMMAGIFSKDPKIASWERFFSLTHPTPQKKMPARFFLMNLETDMFFL